MNSIEGHAEEVGSALAKDLQRIDITDRREWSRFLLDTWKRVQSIDLEATSKLKAFKCVDDRAPSGAKITALAPADVDLSLTHSLVVLANDLWVQLGGTYSPNHALSVLEFSRRKFAHFQIFIQLMDCLTRLDVLKKRVSKARVKKDWPNADRLVRSPKPQKIAIEVGRFLASEKVVKHGVLRRRSISAAENFKNIIEFEKDIDQEKWPNFAENYGESGEKILSAIALSWVDEAAAKPASAITLLSEASFLIQKIGALEEQFSYESYLEKNSIVAIASRGGNARNASNQADRDAALSMYDKRVEAGDNNKNAAAREISVELDLAFKTVRNWLRVYRKKGVPGRRKRSG